MSKNLAEFFRETRQEARKVTWPKQKETAVTTVIVFIMIFIVSMILMTADGVISEAVKLILALGAK
ncbi:MAG: preprotein translocase subunit SecE [Alphaproteobacteria bacterium]|nr:preprotein translocase subunit SecE [Alphaproteobacteria bacterium]MDE2335818.1 preprotein translocase subunit SecE [Alphaproteobacteria bacterium]